MKKLPHHAHIVAFFGAYSRADQSGILMGPVASYSLESYLRQPLLRHHGDGPMHWLSNQFSCLVAGLKTLHDRGIQHRDIKPANILISDGNIMFCDFGLSGIPHSPTPSDPMAMTKVYASPEAVRGDLRKGSPGRSCDIWSLGCVFLEMATWLCHRTVAEFRDFRAAASHSEHPDTSYHGNVARVRLWIAFLRRLKPPPPVPGVLEACKSMLSEDEAKRPDIHQLAKRFPPFPCCVPPGERSVRVATLDSGVDLPAKALTASWPAVQTRTGWQSSSFTRRTPDGYSQDTWHGGADVVTPSEMVEMSRRSTQAFLRWFDAEFSDCTMASDISTRSFIRDDMIEELDILLKVESSKGQELEAE